MPVEWRFTDIGSAVLGMLTDSRGIRSSKPTRRS